MKLGNASWGFRETELEKQVQITRDMNLEYLELGIAGHENDFLQANAGDAEIEKVKEMFSQYNIELFCASTGNDFTLESESDCLLGLETVKKAIVIAAKLGIKFLRIFAGFSSVEEVIGDRWKTQIDCLNVAVACGAENGVGIAIETHGGVEVLPGGVRHFLSTTSKPEVLLQLLKEVDSRAGLVFDPANLGAVGFDTGEVIEIYRSVKERVSYFHLKDFRKVDHEGASPLAIEACACGEGKLDWGKLMQEFASFEGVGVMEYEIPDDIKEGLRRTLRGILK